jgi:hypothetical protein
MYWEFCILYKDWYRRLMYTDELISDKFVSVTHTASQLIWESSNARFYKLMAKQKNFICLYKFIVQSGLAWRRAGCRGIPRGRCSWSPTMPAILSSSTPHSRSSKTNFIFQLKANNKQQYSVLSIYLVIIWADWRRGSWRSCNIFKDAQAFLLSSYFAPRINSISVTPMRVDGRKREGELNKTMAKKGGPSTNISLHKAWYWWGGDRGGQRAAV